MTEWQVTVARSDGGVGRRRGSQRWRALAALEPHGVTGAGRYDFTMSVEAASPARARAAAIRAVERARAETAWPSGLAHYRRQRSSGRGGRAHAAWHPRDC